MPKYRVIGLGEQTHGSATDTLARMDFLLAAIRKGSITICMEEGPIGATIIDDYLHRRHPFDTSPPYGGWRRVEYAYMFELIREAKERTGHDCRIIGVDPTAPWDGITPTKEMDEWTMRLWQQVQKLDACQKREERLKMRVAMMAENVLATVARPSEEIGQCFFFAHGFHVGKRMFEDGGKTSGYIIGEKLGKGYLAIAYVSAGGHWTCRADRKSERRHVEAMPEKECAAYAKRYEANALTPPVGVEIWSAGVNCDWRSTPHFITYLPDTTFDFIYMSPASSPSIIADQPLSTYLQPGVRFYCDRKRRDHPPNEWSSDLVESMLSSVASQIKWWYEKKLLIVQELRDGGLEQLRRLIWLYAKTKSGIITFWLPSIENVLRSDGREVRLLPHGGKFMSFPANEYEAYSERIMKRQPIITTRSQDEMGRYVIGEVVESVFGQLGVESIIYLPDGYHSHPYKDELTEGMRAQLEGYEAELIELRQISDLSRSEVSKEKSKTDSAPAASSKGVIEEVSSRYGIAVKQATEEFCRGYDLFNEAAASGNEIALGIFDSEENRLFAFFHELGHLLSPLRNRSPPLVIEAELEAWIQALRVSREEYGIRWSKQAFSYMIQRLMTYFSGEEEAADADIVRTKVIQFEHDPLAIIATAIAKTGKRIVDPETERKMTEKNRRGYLVIQKSLGRLIRRGWLRDISAAWELIDSSVEAKEWQPMLSEALKHRDVVVEGWKSIEEKAMNYLKNGLGIPASTLSSRSILAKIVLPRSHSGFTADHFRGVIYWGHDLDRPNYANVYLLHELMHVILFSIEGVDSAVGHALIELAVDNEFRIRLNEKGEYFDWEGHPYLAELEHALLDDWKAFLSMAKAKRDFIAFAKQMSKKYVGSEIHKRAMA